MSQAAVLQLGSEHERIRRRTRRGIIWSSVAHLVLLVLMTMQQHLAPEPLALTEITWLDPVEPIAAAAPVAVETPPTVEKPTEVARNPVEKTVQFKRAAKPAVAKPQPQKSQVLQDRLQERLASLRQKTPALPQTVATANARPRLSRPTTSPPIQSDTVDLKRGQAVKPKPMALTRQSTKPAPRLQLASAPERKLEAAITEDTAPRVRDIAGAELLGPVADRALVSHRVPRYPSAAMSEAREGSVTLRFIVLATGVLKENILVERTSGHADLDAEARAALREWRFEELPRGSVGEQWGLITFHFKISVTNAG